MNRINKASPPAAVLGSGRPRSEESEDNEPGPSQPHAASVKPVHLPSHSPARSRAISHFLSIRREDTGVPKPASPVAGASHATASSPFSGKPEGTCAILPNGLYAIAPQLHASPIGYMQFHIFGADNKLVGKIDATVVDNPHDDCIALTWIEKGEAVPNGATDFALWHLSKHAPTSSLEVSHILNEDLLGHLLQNYQMEDVDDDKVRGNVKDMHAIAERRLLEKGWTLK